MEENEEEFTEVEYPKAKLYKRWLAGIIDVFIAAMIGLILYSLTSIVNAHVSIFQEVVSTRDTIQQESFLYDNDGKVLSISVEDDSELTYTEKKTTLSTAIENFYHNDLFFTEDTQESYYLSYQERKAAATNDSGVVLFVEDSSNEGYYIEASGTDEDYFNFYYTEINNYCLGYMSLNSDYKWATSIIFNTSVVEIVICMGIGYFLSFCLIPFFIKRGHRTIGMYLFKISLISVDALNVTNKNYWIRSLWVFLIGYCLDIVTVFIPFMVSLAMMHLSKANQDFFDYMTNTYVVDTAKKDVYLDMGEYLSRKGLSKKASIEEDDLKFKF